MNGCGIDIVSIPDFDKLTRDTASLFVEKYFTEGERRYSEASPGFAVTHLAGFYAAKEATIKALESIHLFRPRLIESLNYREIEVEHDPFGRPYLSLSGEIRKIVDALKVQAAISISHDGDYAVAQVILS